MKSKGKYQKRNYSSSSSSKEQEEQKRNQIINQQQFHTFSGNKGETSFYNKNHQRYRNSSQQKQHKRKVSLKEARDQSEQSSQSKDEEDQSIDIIEARIKKLQIELSNKLKNISPQRNIQKSLLYSGSKRNDKSKLQQSPQRVIKSSYKKQVLSPYQKKNNTYIPNKSETKHVNQRSQNKTSDNKISHQSDNKKSIQSRQINPKEYKYYQAQQQTKKQNDKQKIKISSKSKPKKNNYLQKDIEQMNLLKNKIQGTELTKLQKQIQLLKILQSIRGKLKKSINHKLNKLYPDLDRSTKKRKVSTFLMHKGCPANYLS